MRPGGRAGRRHDRRNLDWIHVHEMEQPRNSWTIPSWIQEVLPTRPMTTIAAVFDRGRRNESGSSFRGRSVCLAALGVALALAPAALHGAAQSESVIIRQAPEADTAMFAVVIQALARRIADPIRVDPRPLRPGPGIGVFVRPEHFADEAVEVARRRAAVLDRLGIAQFRKVPFDDCGSGPGGTPPPIEPGDTVTLREWLSRPKLPTCVLVSLPRAEGVYFPERGIDRRSADPDPARRTVRVVTIGSGQAVDVLDVVVRCERGGRWRVEEIVLLAWLRS